MPPTSTSTRPALPNLFTLLALLRAVQFWTSYALREPALAPSPTCPLRHLHERLPPVSARCPRRSLGAPDTTPQGEPRQDGAIGSAHEDESWNLGVRRHGDAVQPGRIQAGARGRLDGRQGPHRGRRAGRAHRRLRVSLP